MEKSIGVTCLICGQTFSTIISHTHLKQHNMSTKDYKALYGKDSISSEAYRNSRSNKMKGEANPNFGNKWSSEQKISLSKKRENSIPWNKGIKLSNTEAHKDAAIRREADYDSGKLKRREYTNVNDITKHKISDGVKLYAESNAEELSERARKAINTKIASGVDIAFFRGKHHSEETKLVLKNILVENSHKRSEQSLIDAKTKAALVDLTITNIEGVSCEVHCGKCETAFNITKQYFTESKFFDTMCPTCHPRKYFRSSGEIQIAEFLESIGCNVRTNVRIPDVGEIDMLIDGKVSIEYNGLYWHSENVLLQNNKSKLADYIKSEKMKEMGYRHICIFEDEWINSPDIVKSRIANILGKSSKKIFARKCKVVELDAKTASEFCIKNHSQGKARSNYRYGLTYNGELVSVMTFSNSNLSRKIKSWEINRFCSKLGVNIIGGANKLFKHFTSIHNVTEVISYADKRWSDGGLYKSLGFVHVSDSVPNYWYLKPNELKRYHRFNFRTRDGISEKERVELERLNKIWDCGSSKWLWSSVK